MNSRVHIDVTKYLAGFTVGLSLISVPLLAADREGTDDPDQVICKREKKVNSRFTTRTCHTRAQWAAIAEQNKRDYAETRDRPKIDIGRD